MAYSRRSVVDAAKAKRRMGGGELARSGGTRSARWAREQNQRWPYGLGAVLIGVVLPVAFGMPAPDARVLDHASEIVLAISLMSGFACVLLMLAASVGRRWREALFAIGGIGLTIAHPLLDGIVLPTESWVHPARLSVGALSLLGFARLIPTKGFAARSFGWAGSTLAAMTLVVAGLDIAGSGQHGASLTIAALAFGLGALSLGSVSLIYGQRWCDGALTAFALAAVSVGFGELTLLSSGGLDPTIGLTLIAVTGAVTMLAAAMMSLFEALARAEIRHDALVVSRELAISRLEARADRFAELAHDQRSSLLAIEAAAERMRAQPSGELAAAVASEAARLNRLLSTQAESLGSFDLRAAVMPMVQCMEALGSEIGIRSAEGITVWGDVDEVVEIVGVLIDNALNHGTPPIHVAIEDRDGSAVLRVTDGGPGVPEPLRESVFERGVTTMPASHSGLGLYSARRMAEAHGGGLRIADDRAFELTLPSEPSGVAAAGRDVDAEAVPERGHEIAVDG